MGLVLAALPVLAFAQTSGDDAAAGVALFSTGLGCVCSLIGIAIWIFMIYWVYTDAKKRNNPNAIVWVIVTVLTSWVGLLLYVLIGRNQGTSMGGPPPAGPTGPSTTARY
jgi:hypothetical protein